MPEQSLPTGAVFISYGSQDAVAAVRICEALRAVGVEVWFDQSELRGGDSWDAQIKKHIHDCAIFIPVISAHTNARTEGYFRREWNLATRRLLDMAHDTAFLVPVVVDGTREADARVPEEFLRAQWTWLRDGETPPAFAQRVRQLLGGDSTPVHQSQTAVQPSIEPSARSRTSTRPWFWLGGSDGRHRVRGAGIALVVLLLVLSGGAYWYYRGAGDPPAPEFAPPPNSVAVLAFTNMSGDAKDEYFSDGLSEELLNTLVRIDKLQVAARTSSFSFKGTAVDIPTVGRKLNVAAVLEGSVRKAGERVRITAQLINTVTGYHLWSQTFDRDLNDILALQTEIATNVASALKVVLLADEKKQLTDGGTTNPAAFEAYLRGREVERLGLEERNLRRAIGLYEEAIRLDPDYAFAYACRAVTLTALAGYWTGTRTAEREELEAKAMTSVNKAVALAPTSGLVYASLGLVLSSVGTEFAAVDAAFRRGLAIEPGNAELQSNYSRFAVDLGRPDAIAAAKRAVQLSPLDPSYRSGLGVILFYSRDFVEARAAFNEANRLREISTSTWLGTVELAAGQPEAAVAQCEPHKNVWDAQVCLAIAYHQLGRKSEAAAIMKRLTAENGDSLAYQYAEIYAYWGQKPEALEWLATAYQLQDPGLADIKVDPLIDPLRDEPQFKQIVERLNFPK